MISIHHGDCLTLVPAGPTASVDACITDPPYAGIDRSYGRFTEAEWWELMMPVCQQVRRVLKPTGSAKFVLQPNWNKTGQMSAWVWRFLLWAIDNWNVVQVAYWWNTCTMPGGPTDVGLMRNTVKYLIWCGPPDCYRNQDAVLWEPLTDRIDLERQAARVTRRKSYPSGHGKNIQVMAAAALRRGGVTPMNLFPIAHASHNEPFKSRIFAHAARTPYVLADWWVRYITPPGGMVLDPFVGTGTTMLAAYLNGRDGIGFDQDAMYVDIALDRIDQAMHVREAEAAAGRTQQEASSEGHG